MPFATSTNHQYPQQAVQFTVATSSLLTYNPQLFSSSDGLPPTHRPANIVYIQLHAFGVLDQKTNYSRYLDTHLYLASVSHVYVNQPIVDIISRADS